MVSAVYQVTWGSATTLSSASSGLSAGTGSTANTSRPAAASRPARSASTSAASSTIAPREVLTSTASRFIRGQRGRVEQAGRRDRSAAGAARRCRWRRAARAAAASRDGRRRGCWCAALEGERPSPGRSSRRAWRRCRTRPARRCNCRCRARSRRGSDPTASLRPPGWPRSSAGSLRSAASISSTAPSATDGALAPGMLATAMPQPGRGVDVDGVHAGAQLVHQPAAPGQLEVVARQRSQHVPDHLGLGQLAVEGVVVVFGAVSDVQPIGLLAQGMPAPCRRA